MSEEDGFGDFAHLKLNDYAEIIEEHNLLHHARSFSLLGQVLLELILGALLGIGQVFKQPDHVVLQKAEALSSADSHLLLLHLLKLVHAIADVHPAACTGVLDDWVSWILFRGHFVNGLSVALQNLTGIPCTSSTSEHGGVGADGDVADREEVVL